MPLLRNHLPKDQVNTRIRDAIDGYEIDVVESVCSVARLADVCRNDYMSIPVVNMAGKLIGMIPKNFVIILIENHSWYDSGNMRLSRQVSNHYQTFKDRRLSNTNISNNHKSGVQEALLAEVQESIVEDLDIEEVRESTKKEVQFNMDKNTVHESDPRD